MPTVPVAYEAGPRSPRSSYESRVKEVLRTLGSSNPDEDIAATGPLLENSKKAKMDPAAAAGIIYATSRHRHPPTSVLRTVGASEAYKKVTEYYRPLQTVVTTAREMGGRGDWTFKREGDRDVMYDSFGDRGYFSVAAGQGPKAVELMRKMFDKQSKRHYTDAARINAQISALPGYREDERGTSSNHTAAEDSSPAPCTKPARTVSDECQRLAKEIGPIRSDKELYALVAPQMRKEPQEVFYVVCCDVHGDLVSFTEVARGQVSRVAVDMEDVLGAVLSVRPRPTIYYVAHCHPSGKARPSEADEKLTEAIRRASAVAMPNVVFGDHIVVAGGEGSREYYSFADKRLKRA